MINKRNFLLLTVLFVFTSCTITKENSKYAGISRLHFLSEYVVPFNTFHDSTLVGGLSGIDYNQAKDEYYLISDDRSQRNPARFYTAKISIEDKKIDSVYFVGTTFLKDKRGKVYPNANQHPGESPDPEAMRFNQINQTLIWSSEGERISKGNEVVLQNPSVTEINNRGLSIASFPIPAQFQMTSTDYGPRQNGVFEGLTFDSKYQNLFVSTEEPLYQDGPRAGINDSAGIIRIIKYNLKNKKPEAQYAYTIDPVAYAPVPDNGFKVNGISDILWVGKNQLLVIERSFSVGRLACTIKVFLADLSKADNIQKYPSLKNVEVRKVPKKLLLNMDELGFYIDNIEGVTFGPLLPNGKRTLIFVADNNFNPLEKTQFLLFEVE
jgi:hypothetical protein